MNNQTVTPTERDEALFQSMARDRKRRRTRIIRTVIILAVVIAVGGFIGVTAMRRSVTARFARSGADVKNYTATIGTISTTVSGTGVINDVDTEDVSVPNGVEIDEVIVDPGDAVKEGDIIASVKQSAVFSAISAVQDELNTLDAKIRDAETDRVSVYVETGITGRVKRLIAQPGDKVLDVMTEHGALAYMSIDGCMAVDIETDKLRSGDSVTIDTNDRSYTGTVETVSAGLAKITLTDDGPKYDDNAVVKSADGAVLGSGKLYIHNPIAVTGYAGTISYPCLDENGYLAAGGAVYILEGTETSASYDALVQQRRDKEAELTELMHILSAGAVCAPLSGTVSTVDYSDKTPEASVYTTAAGTKLKLISISPDKEVSVTIPVDESNILSLKVGQEADVKVKSISDETITGNVTEINKVATSASGVTQYSAVITFPKAARMLQGMTADADVRIEGVENAVIIPADALHQTSTIHYVYTSYDSETKEYGGMKEVTPGVSNSNYVEIISGLNAGETVYYVEKQNFNFMQMMMGGSASRNSSASRTSAASAQRR